MLDHAGAATYEPLIAAAAVRLRLPPEIGTDPPRNGRGERASLDERQTARIPTLLLAAAEISQSLEAFPRPDSRAQVLVRDVSLRGIRFLYHQQLYPGEGITVWLPEVELTGEVARAQRLAEGCYEIGARLDEALPARLLKRLLAARRPQLPGH